MSELLFFCPNCNQKIQCDALWGGHKLQCPSCKNEILVPLQEAAAAPPPPAAAPQPGRLTIGRHQPAAAPTPAPTPVQSAPRMVYQPPAKVSSGKGAGVIKFAVALIGLAVGGYLGFTAVSSWQKKMNSDSRQAEQNSDGGQVGHIKDLYSVLDATDPNNFGRYGDKEGGAAPGGGDVDVEDMPRSRKPVRSPAAETVEKELPLIPATWTLELETAKIPEGRANGSISGTNFVVEAARVDRVAQSYVLTLRQGSGVSADREMLIYLRVNPGETLASHAWQVTKDQKGANVPRVIKRWKTNPKFAAQQKVFNAGYALKLQLGPLTDETISGKIYLALPDPEQSVVAGIFKLKLAPVQTGMQPGMPMSMGEEL